MEFELIEDSFILLRKAGIYKINNIYKYNNELYAKWGTGYIALYVSGNTSSKHIYYSEFILPDNIRTKFNTFGKMIIDT